MRTNRFINSEIRDIQAATVGLIPTGGEPCVGTVRHPHTRNHTHMYTFTAKTAMRAQQRHCGPDVR